jgi:hypothetical protein
MEKQLVRSSGFDRNLRVCRSSCHGFQCILTEKDWGRRHRVSINFFNEYLTV